MKKLLKKSLAVLLVLTMLSGLFAMCASAEKEYFAYEKYVLLGDSVASGHDDILYLPTEFIRVEGSYSDLVADALGAELIPMACPGFRTIEMRYMLEDDYDYDDAFMFHDTQDPEVMKARIPEYRQNIAEADLITLGVGGNDFGTMLTWLVADIMEENGVDPEVVKEIREIGNEVGAVTETVDKLVELANTAKALPSLLEAVPAALAKGLVTFFTNCNIMIEDIYALNPDVTLLVIGMFDNAVKSEEDLVVDEAAAAKINIGQMIVDMANTPMKEGAKKYGYTFVDTTGTICVTYHPTAEGHQHIAECILEALPDASFPYTDVEQGTPIYNAVSHFYKNGILEGVSATEFGVDNALTKEDLAHALYGLAGSPEVTVNNPFTDVSDDACVWAAANGYVSGNGTTFGPDEEVSAMTFALTLFSASSVLCPGLLGMIKGLVAAVKTVFESGFSGGSISRGNAVVKLYELAVL